MVHEREDEIMWDNERMDKLLEEICDFYNHLDDLGELHDSFHIRDTRSKINIAEDVFIEAVELIKEEKWKELD